MIQMLNKSRIIESALHNFTCYDLSAFRWPREAIPHYWMEGSWQNYLPSLAYTLSLAVHADLLPEPADDAGRLGCRYIHCVPWCLHIAHQARPS